MCLLRAGLPEIGLSPDPDITNSGGDFHIAITSFWSCRRHCWARDTVWNSVNIALTCWIN